MVSAFCTVPDLPEVKVSLHSLEVSPALPRAVTCLNGELSGEDVGQLCTIAIPASGHLSQMKSWARRKQKYP